jgi:hypothetical protein
VNCNVNLEEHDFVNLIFEELTNYVLALYKLNLGFKIEKGDLVLSKMVNPQEKCLKCGFVRKMENE